MGRGKGIPNRVVKDGRKLTKIMRVQHSNVRARESEREREREREGESESK